MTSNATRHGSLVGVVALMAVALLAACGSTSGASPATSSSAGAALSVIQDGTTPLLADASGHAIYLLTSDSAGTSTCNGACATAWPPVAAGSTTIPSGVTASLGTATRSDGSSQLTVQGHPVYTFQGDSAPDMVAGEGVTSFGVRGTPCRRRAPKSPRSRPHLRMGVRQPHRQRPQAAPTSTDDY